MAFKNLEQRYTERSKALYAAATLKFDGGKPSRGANDDPLIVRKPGDGYWRDGEGRGLPVRSTENDVKRLTRFTLGQRGIQFLAKQQLLQTGNTFARTRLLNPTFVVGNGVPFLHIQRNINTSSIGSAIGTVLGISAIKNLFSKPTATSLKTLRVLGTLQKETYDNLIPPTKTGKIGRLLSRIPVVAQIKGTIESFSNDETGRPEIGDGEEQYFIRKLLIPINNKIPEGFLNPNSLFGKIKSAFLSDNASQASTFKFGGNLIPVGSRNYDGPRYNMLGITNDEDTSAYLINPEGGTDYTKRIKILLYGVNYELPATAVRVSALSSTAQEGELFDFPDDGRVELIQKTQRAYQDSVREYFKTEYGEDTTKFVKYFGGGGIRQLAPSSKDGVPSTTGTTSNPVVGKKISYVKDPLNITGSAAGRLPLYDNLPTTGSVKNDIINVSFAMSSDAPVQFRAFVSNISESSTPQYKEYQYIGRVERYISYVSVKRSVGFKLVVVAYSETELETVWKKINYLTALTYPYNVYKGILQPNIVKLTLGNIYTDQPGYVTSIRSDFGGNISSWDINQQVPHGATVDIQFDIIEKQGVTSAGSRLYGILQNEGTGQQQGAQTTTPTSTTPAATATPFPTIVGPIGAPFIL